LRDNPGAATGKATLGAFENLDLPAVLPEHERSQKPAH
jgi:hypothetical protein